MSYYDTTLVKPKERQVYAKKNANQDRVIADFFQENHGSHTPSDVWTKCKAVQNSPLTSVRRSITNLTDRGFLVKLPTQKIGLYGRPEHYWRIAP